jgi:hypothetical protein
VASVTAIEMDLQFSEKTLNQMNPPSKYSKTEKTQKIDHSYFGFVVNAVPPGMISAVYWSITGRE